MFLKRRDQDAVRAAQDPETRLAETVTPLEADLHGRIGVLVLDIGSDWQWGYREDERFLMASTFKSVLCGAVLGRGTEGKLSLDEALPIRSEDILDYAPVTERQVGGTMSVDALCLAALDKRDNTAANVLIDRLGGPEEVTEFLRGIGVKVTRLDRKEPDLNLFDPADLRDTTTPTAILATWDAMLLGDVLPQPASERLTRWMSHGVSPPNLSGQARRRIGRWPTSPAAEGASPAIWSQCSRPPIMRPIWWRSTSLTVPKISIPGTEH